MPTFMEYMRSPLIGGYGSGVSSDVGKSDALSKMASLALLERRLNMGRRNAPRASSGPRDMTAHDQIFDKIRNRSNMNVVYNQEPEQFNKKLALQREELAAKREMNQALLGVKQQQADTQSQRADAYEFGVHNPAGRVITPRGGNVTVVDPRTGRTIDTGVASGTMSQEDELLQRAQSALQAEAARQGGRMELEGARQQGRQDIAAQQAKDRLAQIAAQSKGAQERQNDAQEFNANKPRERAAAINNRAREVVNLNPDYAEVIEFDDNGNFNFVEGIDDDLRKRITKEIYGERKRDINLGKGSDAPQLVGPGQLVTPEATTRFSVNGTNYNIPQDKVEAFLKRYPNARRQ